MGGLRQAEKIYTWREPGEIVTWYSKLPGAGSKRYLKWDPQIFTRIQKKTKKKTVDLNTIIY